MSPDSLASLSRRERQIMDALLEAGECSAREVQQAISDAPSYSAVRALLAKLLEKGVVEFRQDGAKYLYRPAVERETAQKSAVQRLVKTFFQGSASKAVNALLGMKGESLSDDEISELEQMIQRAKNKQGPK